MLYSKLIIKTCLLLFIFTPQLLRANTCQSLLYNNLIPAFKHKFESLSKKDRIVLETLIFMHLGHDSVEEFYRRGFLDYEFYLTPNIAPKGTKAPHYKLLMHYKYYTVVIIYNAKDFKVFKSSIREGW